METGCEEAETFASKVSNHGGAAAALLYVKRLESSEELDRAAEICCESFNGFNAAVGLPPEFPSVDIVRTIFRNGFDSPKIEALGLYRSDGDGSGDGGDSGGELVGSNMIDYRDGIATIGPITVSNRVQNGGGGRLLMEAVMKIARQQNIDSVRLMQVCANTKSFSLYLDCGFDPIGTYLEYSGFLPSSDAGDSPSSWDEYDFVSLSDGAEGLDGGILRACSDLHERVAGSARINEIRASTKSPLIKTAVLSKQTKAVVAYTTGTYIGGHTVACNLDALKALLWKQSRDIRLLDEAASSSPSSSSQEEKSDHSSSSQTHHHRHPPPSIHVSQRHDADVARWLRRNGFRLVRMLTLMSYGPHPEPKNGLYFPSIAY